MATTSTQQPEKETPSAVDTPLSFEQPAEQPKDPTAAPPAPAIAPDWDPTAGMPSAGADENPTEGWSPDTGMPSERQREATPAATATRVPSPMGVEGMQNFLVFEPETPEETAEWVKRAGEAEKDLEHQIQNVNTLYGDFSAAQRAEIARQNIEILKQVRARKAKIEASQQAQKYSERAAQLRNIDPSQLTPEQRQEYAAYLNTLTTEIGNNPAAQDPESPLYAAYQEILQEGARYQHLAAVEEQQQDLQTLLARAQGEGLEDLASVRQHEKYVGQAMSNVESVLAGTGGQLGARGQALAQARQAAMAQRAGQERELVMQMEQVQALAGAEVLADQIGSALNEYQFAGMSMTNALAEARNGLDQAGLDAQSAMRTSDMLARAREEAAQAAADRAWKDQLIAGAFTVAGTAIGAFGGPVGAAAGGQIGNFAGQYITQR